MIGNLHFARADLVHLVWVAAALVLLLGWLELRGRGALARFLSAVMQRRLVLAQPPGRRLARLGFVFLTLLCGVGALMRPQTSDATERIDASRIAADIVVALDVSRSMLADDAAPTRLDRAKAEISDMVDELEGHRVGLVAFAGRASLLAPLTADYGYFRMVLRSVDTRTVSRGGTRIGDAIRSALGAFDPGPGSKLILLVTDGEDHESYPREAAEEALEAGVRIVAIGFGSEEGSQITLVDPDTGARELLTHQGAPVVSKLDGPLLREMALTTEGAYVPAGVAALDLESIVDRHIEPIVREAAAGTERVVPADHYPWFILGAIAFLVAAVWIGSSSGRRYG